MSFVAVAIGSAVVAGGGAVLGYAGAKDAASAQEKIAKEQNAMAQQVLEQQRKDRETAVGLAQPSLSELNLIATQQQYAADNLATQLESIRKDRELLDAVDPALKEAGSQAFKLLQGQEAAALGPLKDQRARERQSLESNLRAQLGSGYSTSSAGIEALSRFDSETGALTQSAQQQTLGQFLGLAASVRPDIAGKTAQAYGSSSNILGSALAGQQNITGRQVAAYTGSNVNYQNVINTAGASYVGDLGNANAMAGLGQGIAGIGGVGVGYGIQGIAQGQQNASQAKLMDDFYAKYGRAPSVTFNASSPAAPTLGGYFGGTNPYASGGSGLKY